MHKDLPYVRRPYAYAHEYINVNRACPEYKLWRMAVLKRDGFKCKKCHKKLAKGSPLQVHHIRKYADYPELRFILSNGITLCWNCHKVMKDCENGYIPMCISLISNTSAYLEVQRMLREEETKERAKNEESDDQISGD